MKHRSQLFEEYICFSVAGDESGGVSVDNGGEYQTLLRVTRTLKYVGDVDKLSHLSEVSGLNLLKRRIKLQPLLSENEYIQFIKPVQR